MFNDVNMVAHATNVDLFCDVIEAARDVGLRLTVYRSSLGNFDGHWRYAAYDGPARPFGIRSKDVFDYEQARYSKHFRPSIKGEREALEMLLETLREFALDIAA